MNITEMKTALEVLEDRTQQYESRHRDILRRLEALAAGLATVPALSAEIDTLTSEYAEIVQESERLQVNTPVASVARLEEVLASIRHHDNSHAALEERLQHEGKNFPERLEAAHDAALNQQQAD